MNTDNSTSITADQLSDTSVSFVTWNGGAVTSALRISDTEWETPTGDILSTEELAAQAGHFISTTPWMTPEMFDRLRVIDRVSADAAQCCATREQVLSLSLSPKWQAAVRAL